MPRETGRRRSAGLDGALKHADLMAQYEDLELKGGPAPK